MKQSELNRINQELNYLEEILSDSSNQFTEFEQDQASFDLEKIIEILDATYKKRVSEKVIQLF
ncbi:MAG: hypothetical protein JNM24_02335 [Bdellovibrionaceae bacterium]|nr:hypothetical protein [Pseudobdellovibrionaceae bacterium]